MPKILKQRKRTVTGEDSRNGIQKTYEKNPERPVQKYRRISQLAFVLLCVWIGVEFHLFVRFLESGGAGEFPGRPPGAEAFLPISSLISLYHFFLTGEIHPAHPAGFFILLAVLVSSFFIGKSFCAYICPFGLLSEKLGDAGEKIFRRKIAPPRWLDYPLRSLKYLLLGFFVYSIFFLMSGPALQSFLDSPYNLVSDIKMYYFFAHISRVALIVIAALFLLSIIIRNFWCRYLCPYGGLLGILSLLSPSKIERNPETCIECGRCADSCPSRIKVNEKERIYSDECIACLHCVDTCPVADTLALNWRIPRRKIPKKWVAIIAAGIFVSITLLGRLLGHWESSITPEEYLYHQPRLEEYGHPRGSGDIETLNRRAEEPRQD
ncbi:MAG: 4Fe-4S binding protein [Planctomycetota bacterium]|jgi:ferredoxin